MELKQISEHFYILPFQEKGDRPNLAYIKGSRFNIMIDAGNSADHCQAFYQCCMQKGLKEPDLCVITHWHWDHTYGMHALKCPSICSKKTQEKLKTVSQWKWDEAAMQQRLKTGEDIAFCDTNIRVEYPDRSKIRVQCADACFEGEMEIDCGNVLCRLITTDSPHSRDALIVHVPKDRVLFVADADCEDFYHGAIYDRNRLRRFIQLIQSLDFETYIVGHAGPETKKEALDRLYQTLSGLDVII